MAWILASWALPGLCHSPGPQAGGLKLADMDILECNEAFAVQNLAVIQELENQTAKKWTRRSGNPWGARSPSAIPTEPQAPASACLPCVS